MALQNRMARELRMLEREPPEGACVLAPDDSNTLQLRAQLQGPAGSPYEDGLFELSIHLPDRYPFEPPKVQFVTPCYHPNIDHQGRICLDILDPPPKGAWTPRLNISTVLAGLRQLLLEPNPDDPLMLDITQEYQQNRSLFDSKVRQHVAAHARGGGATAPVPSSTQQQTAPRCAATPTAAAPQHPQQQQQPSSSAGQQQGMPPPTAQHAPQEQQQRSGRAAVQQPEEAAGAGVRCSHPGGAVHSTLAAPTAAPAPAEVAGDAAACSGMHASGDHLSNQDSRCEAGGAGSSWQPNGELDTGEQAITAEAAATAAARAPAASGRAAAKGASQLTARNAALIDITNQPAVLAAAMQGNGSMECGACQQPNNGGAAGVDCVSAGLAASAGPCVPGAGGDRGHSSQQQQQQRKRLCLRR